MTRGRAIWEDAKKVGTIVGLTIGLATLGGLVYRGIVWAQSRVSTVDADAKHEEIKRLVYTRQGKDAAKEAHDEIRRQLTEAINGQTEAIKDLREDVKVIRQRTWDLVKDERGR